LVVFRHGNREGEKKVKGPEWHIQHNKRKIDNKLQDLNCNREKLNNTFDKSKN
jgi:hypothetical protein